MDEPDFEMTNGYTLKRLRTFGETSKWLLSGTIAILFFTYDKLDFTAVKLLSFAASLVPITCLTGAYFGFKKYADYLEDQVEINDSKYLPDQERNGKAPYSSQAPGKVVWPDSVHRNYKRGCITFAVYAFLVLMAVALVKKEKGNELQPGVVYNQVFNHGDTARPPVSPYTIDQVVPIENIYFSTALWDLRPESFPSLNRVVDTLRKYPLLKIEIRAHTDDVGTETYNQTLSEHRADTAVKYILSKGIESARVRSKGFGESMPFTHAKTADARQLNRRVEFKVLGN